MPGYSVTYTVVDNATKQIDAINRRMAAMRAPMERMSKQVSRFVDVSGLRKVADGFSWIARTAGMAVRSLGPMIPMLGAITSASVITGMVKLVSSFAAWGNQLQTNADQIGISTDELQKFQDATTAAGGNAQDMTDALKNLHKTSVDALTGMNTTAASFFRRFNIDLHDSNGNIKTATQLLPEVFKALDSLQDPADRARVSSALLGDEQAKLYETYKQSGKSLQDFLKEQENAERLSPDQLKALNNYRLAVAGLETAFSQLGRQIAATAANNLTPFIKDFSQWTKENGPEIKQFFKELADTISAVGTALEKTFQLIGIANRKFTKADVLNQTPFYTSLTKEQQAMVRKQVGVTEEEEARAQPAPTTSFWHDPMGWLGNQLFREGKGNVPTAMDRARDSIQRQTSSTVGQQMIDANAPLAPAAGKGAFYDEQRQLIYDAAKRANLPHPEVVAEVGATQAQVESQGGTRTPGGFNVYGIKSGGGVGTAGAPVATQEESGGVRHTEQASFAMFKNKDDAADAYIQFLQKHPSHYQGVLDADTVAKGLHAQGTSGYATASNYESTLFAVNRQFGALTPDADKNAPRQFAASAPADDTAPSKNAPREFAANTTPPDSTVNVDITHKNAPPDATVTARGSGNVNVNPIKIEVPQLAFNSP